MRSGELRKHGRKVRLTGRPFDILAMLLERPGDLITREEIQARLWSADTFVDFEHGVNTAVRKLRGALGDSAEKPRFVETLPRRGYRFIATVDSIERAPSPGHTSSATEPPASEPGWVGQIATVSDPEGANFLLLPADEDVLAEKERCEAAGDDLGISLLAADEKLMLVPCGTTVKILEAQRPQRGCRARILAGHFIGVIAFVPRKYLHGLSQTADA